MKIILVGKTVMLFIKVVKIKFELKKFNISYKK